MITALAQLVTLTLLAFALVVIVGTVVPYARRIVAALAGRPRT